MIEKVNPSHPDKIADRIAGALVDMAYAKQDNPKIAVEVLIGHNKCDITAETSVELDEQDVHKAVDRITGRQGSIAVFYNEFPQDKHLANNQGKDDKCGDNGIFKGVPLSFEEREISRIARKLYKKYPYDGKFIYDLDRDLFVACQSNVDSDIIYDEVKYLASDISVNPIGEWTGGINVDTGATNRKLGSDMARAITGGGLHGKDLSKADVSLNIYAHQLAQQLNKEVNICCAIGDDTINGVPYTEIKQRAAEFIKAIGGFEKFAEWGLF